MASFYLFSTVVIFENQRQTMLWIFLANLLNIFTIVIYYCRVVELFIAESISQYYDERSTNVMYDSIAYITTKELKFSPLELVICGIIVSMEV